MTTFLGYHCSVCGEEYPPEDIIYICPKDGGVLDVVMDLANIGSKYSLNDIFKSEERSMWRYQILLPTDKLWGKGTPLEFVGWTPVYSPPKLKKFLGVENLWIKDESSNPTGSFKDRASALLIARSCEIGVDTIVTASTGNAGAALAGMAASIEKRAVILAPKTAPKAKITQLLIYGAKVMLIDGNYDQAVALALELSKNHGWYCRNTGYNPFTAEGKKTAAFEIWEQVLLLGLQKPLSIFVSVGDGNIISGIHKGFKDLFNLGWIKQIPRLFGVQAVGSSAIANAFMEKTEDIKPVISKTIADSISVNMPADGLRALRAATETEGAYITVSDTQILDAQSILGKAGIFAEPAGAAAFAGLMHSLNIGLTKISDPVLVLNTGNGLKDPDTARRAVADVLPISPSLDVLEAIVHTWQG